MGTRPGGKAVILEGRKKFAFPREVDGTIRWFVDDNIDVTENIALENDTYKEGPPEDEKKEVTSSQEIAHALLRLDSQVQGAKEVLKDVEVHLRAIKQQLNGADYLRELAIVEEQERAKKRGLRGHEKMTNRNGRTQNGGVG